MRIIDKVIKCKSRSDVFEIWPLGDIHMGARGCAEKPLRKVADRIGRNPNAYAIGGGDWLEAVLPSDYKRFDFDSIPDWMLDGGAKKVKRKLKDVLTQQRKRLKGILSPIDSEHWLGAIEGNHEYAISKHHNRDIHAGLCADLDIEDLTDEALVRLRFQAPTRGPRATVILYIRHGYGGGRTPGAEPNKIARMVDEWEIADVCFTGHSHTFCIVPPKAVLEIPKKGSLASECSCRYRWGANWGCWVRSHPAGEATYNSRSCFPARPLLSCYATIQPLHHRVIKGRDTAMPQIEIRQVTL